MLFELVKNSLRAVQERYMNSDEDVPPVRIIVADGEEDVTIKVAVRHLLSCMIKPVNLSKIDGTPACIPLKFNAKCNNISLNLIVTHTKSSA
jgi:hypothetical protein